MPGGRSSYSKDLAAVGEKQDPAEEGQGDQRNIIDGEPERKDIKVNGGKQESQQENAQDIGAERGPEKLFQEGAGKDPEVHSNKEEEEGVC